MTNKNPIGVFDSGIGGLSIAHEVCTLLPSDKLIYIADSLHAPYGEKSDDAIYQRCTFIVEFLLAKKVKAIVIACNTATVSCIAKLRANYAIPIIGVEPGIKPALLGTKGGVIGVLATSQTINSQSLKLLLNRQSNQGKVVLQACPGLMEQVEALELDNAKTRALVERYVQPFLVKGVDQIVLGCTHYTFLSKIIRSITGPSVELVRTELAVAKETARQLEINRLLAEGSFAHKHEFLTTGNLEYFRQQVLQIWEDLSPLEVGVCT